MYRMCSVRASGSPEGLLFCFRERPSVSHPSLHLGLNAESGCLHSCLSPRGLASSLPLVVSRELCVPLSFSFLHPAHVEKRLLNSWRLRGLPPTQGEKQSRIQRGTDRNGPTCVPPQKKPTLRWVHAATRVTRILRNTRVLATHTATDTLKNTTIGDLRTHAAPVVAQTPRRTAPSPNPRDSRVAQPQPTQAAPPSGRPPFSRLPSLPPPPKDVQNTPRNKPGARLLPPRPPAAAPPFILARRRLSPAPCLARPPLLPARRPRRTWTSLSIRQPPRSGSPRLRTDLARGEEERAGERGRELVREPEPGAGRHRE